MSVLRDPLGRVLFPDEAVAGLVARAEQALKTDDLDAAEAGFRAAQSRSPDHPRVAMGLAEARERAMVLAREALLRDAFDEASDRIALAERLGAPADRLEALRRAVKDRAEPSLETRLQRAMAIEATQPEAALADYLAVLARAPDNAIALAGRSRRMTALLADAESALDSGRAEDAAALMARVRSIDPAHLALTALAIRLGARAEDLPADAGAGTRGDSDAARDAARWRGLAEEALGRGALSEARRALDVAGQLDPSAAQQVILEARWQRAKSGASAQR